MNEIPNDFATPPLSDRSTEVASPARSCRKKNCDAKYVVVAKRILACNGAVTRATRCIVRDANGTHKYMTWSQIELEEACIRQEDYGYGVHPAVDREFLSDLKGRKKLTRNDYRVVDAIMWVTKRGNYEITVFLELTDPVARDSLQGRRNTARYYWTGPIRCSPTVFIQAGGTRDDLGEILKRRQPKSIKKTPAACKRKGKSLGR